MLEGEDDLLVGDGFAVFAEKLEDALPSKVLRWPSLTASVLSMPLSVQVWLAVRSRFLVPPALRTSTLPLSVTLSWRGARAR
jgi:hypothetical protein